MLNVRAEMAIIADGSFSVSRYSRLQGELDLALVGLGLPLYENGHQTLFNAPELPGVQVEMLSSRLTGDLYIWYEWPMAEPVDDPRFEWAFRQRSDVVGVARFIAIWDDDVLADVIDGLSLNPPREVLGSADGGGCGASGLLVVLNRVRAC